MNADGCWIKIEKCFQIILISGTPNTFLAFIKAVQNKFRSFPEKY